MSDATQISLSMVTTPCRAVIRNGHNKLYYVYEYAQGYGWQPLDDHGYPHSTSAYAHLGRIVSAENQKAILAIKGE